MNSSTFQSTALPGMNSPAWGLALSPWVEKMLLGAGGTLVTLAIGLAVVAALGASQPVLAWSALAGAMGGWLLMRSAGATRLRRVKDDGLIDAPSGLYNVQGMVRIGSEMLAQCYRDGRPLGIVVLDFTDLPEVRDIYGRDISRKLQGHVVSRMKSLAGARGICARTGRTEFTVLLPGASPQGVQASIQRVLGNPTRIEFDAGDSEIVLVPDLQFESATDLESVGELYRCVSSRLAKAQAQELRRQVWLTRERERHSRPMSLPPSTH
jgi:GGDEF domain-containing protein